MHVLRFEVLEDPRDYVIDRVVDGGDWKASDTETLTFEVDRLFRVGLLVMKRTIYLDNESRG